MKLHLDFETRSAVDLKKVGAWAYAMHPSTEVLCMGLASHGSAPRVLTPAEVRDPSTARLLGLLESTDVISAHNAAFEYAVYNLVLHRRHGWPALWEPRWWSCTMARAAACGLPLDLDRLGRVLGVRTPKDLDGRKAMLRLCKPVRYDPLDGSPVYDDDPELLARMYAYNATDVRAEMEVDEMLPELSADERAVWELDLAVNRRGVAVDLPFARRAAALSEHLVTDLNRRLCELTGGAVDKATRVAAMKDYLADRHGIVVESLDKEGVTDLLADPLLPSEVREVLSVRRQVGKKNSVAKYTAALEMACGDGRVRGLLQYHAAHTGRWGGRGLQPQNFPKGFDGDKQAAVISDVMHACETQDPALTGVGFTSKYKAEAMDALSDALRGLFVPGEGRTMVCADFNAIEARVLFWLAHEEAALAAYRRGESPYVEMARLIYRDPAITKKTHPEQYDIGKRTILGCGYGMGAERFVDNIYAETAKKGKPVRIPDELGQRAVKAYREKYSRVRNLWYEVEKAAINAVKDPSRAHACAGGKVMWGMTRDRRFLACRLPSGRFLRYWKPSVAVGKTPWGDEKEELRYWGEDGARQWVPLKTYGGSLVENVTQAVARDLLAHGMLKVQAAGFDVVLTVHDEVVAEWTPEPNVAYKNSEVLEGFVKMLCDTPVWAAGCPVAAEGWIGGRYRK